MCSCVPACCTPQEVESLEGQAREEQQQLSEQEALRRRMQVRGKHKFTATANAFSHSALSSALTQEATHARTIPIYAQAIHLRAHTLRVRVCAAVHLTETRQTHPPQDYIELHKVEAQRAAQQAEIEQLLAQQQQVCACGSCCCVASLVVCVQAWRGLVPAPCRRCTLFSFAHMLCSPEPEILCMVVHASEQFSMRLLICSC